MAFLATQGYGCAEEYEVAGSLYVPKVGLSFGEFFNLVPLAWYQFFFFTYLMECFRCFYAGRQEVFAAEELVKDTRNEARLADNFRMKANKSLAVTKGRNKELAL